MARGKITKKQVDSIKAKPGDVYVWDADLSGFGLKVTPSGRKVFLVQYRLGGRRGKTRRCTIGRYGSVTVEEARREAKIILGKVASGVDPQAEKTKQNSDITLLELWELFWELHVSIKTKPSTAKSYKDHFERVVSPRLGRKFLRDIKRADVAELHLARASTPRDANQTLSLLSSMFTWAERMEFKPEGPNPCRYISRYPEVRRERYLSIEELGRLATALSNAEARGESASIIAAIRLLIFTGCRRNEILSLRWEYVDFEKKVLRLPDTKTGRRIVHLSPPALAILANLPRELGNKHVLPGRRIGAHLVSPYKVWDEIKEEANIQDLRLHDLRHTYASVGAESGMSLPIIGQLLGHTQPQTTARYAHLADDPLKAANDAIGERIASAMNG